MADFASGNAVLHQSEVANVLIVSIRSDKINFDKFLNFRTHEDCIRHMLMRKKRVSRIGVEEVAIWKRAGESGIG